MRFSRMYVIKDFHFQGLGGKISPHVDSIGKNFGLNYESRTETTSEAMSVGGNRFVTFMVYL